jgi:hypothetical protein
MLFKDLAFDIKIKMLQMRHARGCIKSMYL